MSDAGERIGTFWKHVRFHLVRALRCDFTRMKASADERTTLGAATPAISDERAQDYFAWRRSMAFVALTFAAIALLLALIDSIDQLSSFSDLDHISDAAVLIVLVMLGYKVALAAGLFVAVRAWTDADRSRRALFRGWATAIIVPLALILLPITDIAFNWERVRFEQGDQVAALQRAFVETVMAVQMFWLAVPSLLALFPGLVRAALTVKTFTPARATGPVVGACVAPIYTIVFVTVFGQLQQLSGSLIMGIGILLVAGAPLVVVMRRNYLFPRLDEKRTRHQVGVARFQIRALTVLGILLVFIPLFSTKFLGTPVLGFDSDEAMFSIWSLLDIVIWFIAMLTTYTVVASDGILRAMRASDTTIAAWAGEEDRQRDARLVEMVGSDLAPAAPATETKKEETTE